MKDPTIRCGWWLREGQTVIGAKSSRPSPLHGGRRLPRPGPRLVHPPLLGTPKMMARVVFSTITRNRALADFTGVTAYSQSGVVGAGGPTLAAPVSPATAMPAVNDLRHSAFAASLTTGGAITAANDHGIFADGGNTTYAAIAREGDVAGATGGVFA